MLWTNFLPKPWGSLWFTQKIVESDAGGGPNISDADQDGYYFDLSYTGDIGKTVAALWTVRNAQNNNSSTVEDTFVSSNLWLHGKYAFDGGLGLEWEANWGFGEASATADQDSLGLYANLSYKMDDWTFGGLFIYASGDDNLSDTDAEAFMSKSSGLGKDFNPFQIMTGDYMGMLNGDKAVVHRAVIWDSPPNLGGLGYFNAGAIAFGLNAKYAMSPKTTLSGEIGMFWATDEPTGWDDNYGTEVGVGMSYKLYDNLTYNAHFSYLITGDFFKIGPPVGSPSDYTTEDVWLAAHSLSMKF
jgi:hypothetical protein